jgi:hypothetical protein
LQAIKSIHYFDDAKLRHFVLIANNHAKILRQQKNLHFESKMQAFASYSVDN